MAEEWDFREKMLLPMMSGASAGVIARLACHPIDTLKAKLQVQTTTHIRLLPLLTKTIANEGIAGLYRGIGIAAVGGAPATCIYFTTYEVSKEKFRTLSVCKGLPFLADFAAGFLAETVSCVLFVPIDVVKERLQVQSTLRHAPSYESSWHALRSILRSEGLAGIYKGYLATLASFGPFSALYFLFYEQLKAASLKQSGAKSEKELRFGWSLLNGAGAGAGAGFLTNGLDMVKLRLQVQRQALAGGRGGGSGGAGVHTEFQYRGFLSALSTVIRTEGPGAMFKGAGARVAFFVPSQAISIALFEHFKKLYAGMIS